MEWTGTCFLQILLAKVMANRVVKRTTRARGRVVEEEEEVVRRKRKRSKILFDVWVARLRER